MKDITAAQWDAIAWAQGNFGVSDIVVAKMINCVPSTVRAARVKGGWEVRDLAQAHSGLTGWRNGEGRSNNWAKRSGGQSEPFPPREPDDPANDADPSTQDDPALALERLTAALSRQLQAAASGTPDAAALKRVDTLVAAAKALEKLMALKPKAADEPLADADALAVEEKAKLLAEMDRRIDDLAEQRANEIRDGRSGAGTE